MKQKKIGNKDEYLYACVYVCVYRWVNRKQLLKYKLLKGERRRRRWEWEKKELLSKFVFLVTKGRDF